MRRKATMSNDESTLEIGSSPSRGTNCHPPLPSLPDQFLRRVQISREKVMGFPPGGGILLQVQVMRSPMRKVICVLAATLLASGLPFRSEAKSYGSGGGHSYSSHSFSSGGGHSFSSGGSHSSSSGSSHSFSSGSGHSFNSGSSHSPSGGSTHSSSAGGGTHSASSGGGAATSHGGGVSQGSSSGRSSGEHFSSGSGKSYSAGSTWNENSRHSYTSGKSYSSSEGHNFTSSSGNDSGTREIQSTHRTEPYSGGSPLTFDTAAAHARKEQASKKKFTQFKESQLPPSASPGDTPPSTASP